MWVLQLESGSNYTGLLYYALCAPKIYRPNLVLLAIFSRIVSSHKKDRDLGRFWTCDLAKQAPNECFFVTRAAQGIDETRPKPTLTLTLTLTCCPLLSVQWQVWGYTEGTKEWRLEATLAGHSDWVRDAAWAPNVGLPMCTVASCGQDGKVLVWTQAEAGAPWEPTVVVELQVRANAAH